MSELDRRLARRIIDQLGGSGQPPEYGVEHFSAGLDPYLKVIDEEYLGTFIKDDGSAFKLVVGIYGGGKTHFLYCVRDIGWRQGFAVSYVSLKSGGECPFDRLDLVYKAIASGLLPPVTDADTRPDEVKGVENYLRYWYAQRVAHYLRQGQSGSAVREVISQEIEVWLQAAWKASASATRSYRACAPL